MRNSLKLLLLVGFFSTQVVLGQSNSSSHSLILILPELATLEMSNRSVVENDVLVGERNEMLTNGFSLNYSGAVMADGDYQKTRNVEIEMLGNTLPSSMGLQLIYTQLSENDEPLMNQFPLSNTSSIDLPLMPSTPSSDLQKTDIGIAYQLLGTPAVTADAKTIEIQYTLSDF